MGLGFFATGFSSSDDESEEEEDDDEDVSTFFIDIVGLTSAFAFLALTSEDSLGLRFNGEAVAATEDGGAVFELDIRGLRSVTTPFSFLTFFSIGGSGGGA